MINSKAVILPTLLLPITTLAKEVVKNKQPNVIFILTDDQGKNDLGCEGNQYIQTPNIDKFYSDAVRLTNYHVSTTSAPSRSAIMTGRHTNRLNTYHTISGRSILFEDEVVLPQVFAQNGYATGMFGKWHLGDNYPHRAEDKGFQEVVRLGGGGVGQGPDYWDNDYFDDTYWHNGTPEKYKGYCTDVFFDNAIDFIEDNKDKPFFCYLATNAPHGPLNVPKEYLEKYDNVDIPDRMKRFYGMITNIDDNFKRLEQKLDELGLTENTILIFTTDNGTAGGNQVYTAGMQGAKASVYEGGHRVPFYVRWKNGNLGGGRDINTLTAHYDLFPTFIDLLGFNYTPNPEKPFDGKSLKPLLQGNNDNWDNRILYVDTQRAQNLIKYKAYSVMDDNWRLVNGNQLYDMRNDLAQKTNVIEKHPEVAERLANGYEYWWKSINNSGVNEKYAYIKVGTNHENPVRISSHDMLNEKLSVWNQTGAITAGQATGLWKVEFAETGKYRISLCRFPRESSLAINATFAEAEPNIEIQNPRPASIKDDFAKAYISVADLQRTQDIKDGDKEVTFEAKISEGRYDLKAELIDKVGRIHPAYYLYIEKID